MKERILNVGCGSSDYGTDRIDVVKTPTTTKVANLNLGFPYKDEIFDEVYANNVLEHIKNLDTFANECYRVLKKRGRLYICTDNAAYIAWHVLKSHEHNAFYKNQHKNYPIRDDADDGHYHMFVPSNLKLLFKKFKNHKFSYKYGGRNRIVNNLIKLIPKKMGAISIVMEAEK